MCSGKFSLFSLVVLKIILDIWKAPMKWIDGTFSKLYHYACSKHYIMLEYAPTLHVWCYAQNYAGIIR